MGSHFLKQFFERTVSNTKGKPAGPELIVLIAGKLQLQMPKAQLLITNGHIIPMVLNNKCRTRFSGPTFHWILILLPRLYIIYRAERS